MLRRRPDLIVPIRDRRERRRYLTLKNFAKAMLVLTILFIAITIRSEMRGRTPGEFGRLFRRELPASVEPKPVEVVREAPPPVDDATHPDPLLVQPAARAQWLQDEAATATVVPLPPETPVVDSSASEIAIVGGPDGVTVVRREGRPKPVLSGGFGR